VRTADFTNVRIGAHYRLKFNIALSPKRAASRRHCPDKHKAIEKLVWAAPQVPMRIPTVTPAGFFCLSEHATLALLIHCVCSGGTGKPAVAYKGRAESCPSGFFYGSRRSSGRSQG
jgi:hypothetical protein